jgi:hypothetical protein
LIDTIEERKREILYRVENFVKNTKKYICPIFGADKGGRPYLIGSSVLISLQGSRFIISAAHVFDENRETTLYLGGLKESSQIYSEVTKSVSHESRTNDKIDIAVMPIQSECLKMLSEYDFINEDQIIFDAICRNGMIYSFVGYPASKAKVNPINKNVKYSIYSYWGFTVKETLLLELGLSNATHIAIRFEKDKCTENDENKVVSPDTYGISGGAVWLNEDLNNHSSNSSVNKLAGIGIEWRKDKKCLLGVSIGAALEVIRNQYGIDVLNGKKTGFRII